MNRFLKNVIIVVCFIFVGQTHSEETSLAKYLVPISLVGAGVGCYCGFFRESDDQKIDKATALLTMLSVYQNSFETKLSGGNQETLILACLEKLGFTPEDIDTEFYDRLYQERDTLRVLRNNLWWRGLWFKRWYVNPQIHALEKELSIYLSTSKSLCDFFGKHRQYVNGYQIKNFYKNNLFFLDTDQLEVRIFGQMVHENYPLHAYIEKAQEDIAWIKRARLSASLLAAYPTMVQEVCGVCDKIIESIQAIVVTSSYKTEVDRKKSDEQHAALLQVQMAKAQAQKLQAEAALMQAKAAFESNHIRRQEDPKK